MEMGKEITMGMVKENISCCVVEKKPLQNWRGFFFNFFFVAPVRMVLLI